ncbi:Uncharacterised protein [Bordetella pertussis]|nr:Uncharacterised protein [Bordetella pertussis]CFP11061.1 Uncharacterised protein [Bordetella pertussis]CPJ96628.1 Uncharacterised protein [Bordetella pertussis]CPK85708.1 Uncharacterised protein [Bordetella pertussis]CPP46856.1 Uncharacterised protein [Bordetella pertussis]
MSSWLMPRSIIHSTTPGSRRPGRVPIGRPSSAVKPMVLSTLRPSTMVQAETPLPRWAATILPPAISGSARRRRCAMYSYDRPWKP